MRTTPPPLPAHEIRVSAWPIAAALITGSALGAAVVGWAYERTISDGRVAVAEARLLQTQTTRLVATLHESAVAALKACEGAMPASVAEQRAAMLSEMKRTMKKPPTGVGGGP